MESAVSLDDGRVSIFHVSGPFGQEICGDRGEGEVASASVVRIFFSSFFLLLFSSSFFFPFPFFFLFPLLFPSVLFLK